jgi:fumarate reductase flavoprotein subunit
MAATTDNHVVVLGGGMSGLCAGLAAAEGGADVVVLEAAPRAGGSMRLSGGLVWGPRDLATAREYIPKGDADLQAVLVRELPRAWAWLSGLGLPLEAEIDCLKDGMGRGRMLGLGASGSRGPFADALVSALTACGGSVVFGADVTALRRVDEGWEVDAVIDGASRTWPADRVVSATGGFQNSPDLLRRFVTTSPECLVVRSNRTSDGRGLGLLHELGAELSNGMSSFYGHSLPHLERGSIQPADFIPASQYYSDYTIALNRLGLRFTDESLGVLDEHNAQLGSRQPEGRYHLVFDEGIRRRHVSTSAGLPGVLGSQVSDRLAFVEALGGTVLRAESLEELARKLDDDGVPAENVLDTVRQYNAATDPIRALFPPRQRDHEPLVEPPFYAVSCVAAITYTMGGLAVDERMRVRHQDSGVLTGAYAAGADAGGVFQDVYGGGLGWGLVSGRLAGAEAAS